MVGQSSKRSSGSQQRIWSVNGSSLEPRRRRGAAFGRPRRYVWMVLRAMPVCSAMAGMDWPGAAGHAGYAQSDS
jgi:hypothetical protein